jgi:DNA-binding IclR family transcriptional regulator
MPKYRSNTISSIEELAEEFETVREKGYAVDDAEHEEELRCIAAPIFDHEDSVNSAVSLTFPASRVDREEMEEMAPTLLVHCEDISRKIGWDGEEDRY